ncbi:MAG: biotin/lipoyl-binding protein, partial [Candidatus Syntrophonatronum acetioxidans]
MKTKWKIVLGVIIILVAGVFLARELMKGVEVALEEVTPRDMAISFTEEGEVVPLKERAVHPLYSAPIKSLLVEEGEKIREGDLLALLDHEELEYRERELLAQLQALEGEKMKLEETPGPAEIESYALGVQEAEESLKIAERNYERLEDLYLENYLLRVEEAEESLEAATREYERRKALHEEGYLPTAEYDKVRDQLKKAENYLAQQEHALEVFEEDEYDKARDMVTKAKINVDMQRMALEVLR